jgi:hypothetical protein
MPMQGSSVVQTIDVAGARPERILPGVSGSDFWIVNTGYGLLHLYEPRPDVWDCTELPIGPVYDACGPDAGGLIYCSFFSSSIPAGGFYVFDCAGGSVQQTVLLCSDCPIKGVALSSDESRLYVLGRGWPRLGQSGDWGESDAHPDSGIVWEIDITSPDYDVLDQGITAALPTTIHYVESVTGPDKLFIFCSEIFSLAKPRSCRVDVISLVPGLPREAQILSPFQDYFYLNDLVEWSDEDPLIALCNSFIYSEPEHPEYMDGLWIINTETDSVVETIPVVTSGSDWRGARHALVSEVHPGWVYVTPGSWAADQVRIIDHDTGAYINRIDLADYCIPEFMYELPDGRLIVTAGLAERILIIDPEL